jgi:ankyrin repeat protein
LLINAGADVNSRDFRGYSPLHIVAKSANEEIMSLLLENGAIPSIMSTEEFFNKTPLHRARTGKMVQMLLQYGADPYARYFVCLQNRVDILWLFKKIELAEIQ